MSLTLEQIRALAHALIQLRGDTLYRIAAITHFRSSNLSVWLRGKDQVISALRQAELLRHLGVEGRHLRRDVLHQWRDAGKLEALKQVFELLGAGQNVTLYTDPYADSGPTTRFVEIDKALIQITIDPGYGESSLEITEVLQVNQIVTAERPLKDVNCLSLGAARADLLAAQTPFAPDTATNQRLESLYQQLSQTHQHLFFNAEGWEKLTAALDKAFQNSATPSEVAGVLEKHYRGMGSRPPMKKQREVKHSQDSDTMREQLASALFNKGVTLEEQGEDDDAILAYDELIKCYAQDSDPSIRRLVAQAMFNKGIGLSVFYDQREDAIQAYDEIINCYAQDSDPTILELVDQAVNYKEIMEAGEEIMLSDYDEDDEPLEWEEEKNEELAYLEMIISECPRNPGQTMREKVARAMLYKGSCLEELERREEAIRAYDEMIARYELDSSQKIRDLLEQAKKAKAKLESRRGK
jgi:tetratricopeptide (TPR) repeat protein